MSERYVTLAEVRDLLAEEAEKRELLASQRAALDHSQKVCSISRENAEALKEEVGRIEEISDAAALKIADLLPLYPEDVRAILYKERINLTPEFIDKITDTVEKYL